MTKPVGLTKDAGWQIGVSRTLPIQYQAAWRLLISEYGVELWLGKIDPMEWVKGANYELADGTRGEVRICHPDSHLRLTWQPQDWERSSTIQVRVTPKIDRTTITFHQEHMPDSEARKARREFYRSVLDQLEEFVNQ